MLAGIKCQHPAQPLMSDSRKSLYSGVLGAIHDFFLTETSDAPRTVNIGK